MRMKRNAVLSVLGMALCGQAAAQTPPRDPAQDANDRALQAFRQADGGSNAPQLVREAAGGTRIEWKANIAFDAYRNDIAPPPDAPLTATPWAPVARAAARASAYPGYRPAREGWAMRSSIA